MTEWFRETLHSELSQHLRVDREVYRDRTDVQDLVIFDNERFGRVLTLDGAVQTTERDEFIYHEMMAHVPILAHGAAREVLIIGGGDGGVLRRCLMHPTVEHVTMVEIDRGVVDLCTRYLPSISAGAFDHPKTDLVIADGARFVAETDRRFQVIIVDSTDPLGPGEILFSEAFYQNCKRCLTPGGVVVTQNGVPFLQPVELTNSMQRLRTAFADVSAYRAAVPTYVGGDLAIGWATDDPALRQLGLADLTPRFEVAKLVTEYYTPAVHVGAFALPPFTARLIKLNQ